ncbi:MAG: FkbM family methyltransferase [Gammaproteobacteria bacterium]|nr:FkbM family methyltransferase [Gammaproteobacteria bacterium]
MSLKFFNLLGHTFSQGLLPEVGSVVVDCGSNRGEFALYCAKDLHAKVYSYEADPELAVALPCVPDVTFVTAAVAGSSGILELRRAKGICSSIRFHTDCAQSKSLVPAVTLDQVIAHHDLERIDLLKLDIEGAELDVLENTTDSTLCKCRQICCEFHDFLNPADRPRIRRLISRLSARFIIVCMSTFTYGDVLMINRSAVTDTSAVRLAMIGHKYLAGFRRLSQRIVGRTSA